MSLIMCHVCRSTKEEQIMGALLICLTAALGFLALGVGVLVLGHPTRAPTLLGEREVRKGVRNMLP
jgi:hypothetical protein